MVTIGFVIYYLVPYAFIFVKISLFLAILNTILLGMLFGASIVAAMLQPALEKQSMSDTASRMMAGRRD
jgi:membrane-associated protease RseP (regulator of RpoE activity)